MAALWLTWIYYIDSNPTSAEVQSSWAVCLDEWCLPLCETTGPWECEEEEAWQMDLRQPASTEGYQVLKWYSLNRLNLISTALISPCLLGDGSCQTNSVLNGFIPTNPQTVTKYHQQFLVKTWDSTCRLDLTPPPIGRAPLCKKKAQYDPFKHDYFNPVNLESQWSWWNEGGNWSKKA